MSQLKNKSEINQLAAEFLFKQHLHCSVVHCAYYSCVQFMRHLVFSEFGKTESDLSATRSKTGEGSHEVVISLVCEWLKTKNIKFRDFNNEIVELKKLRVDADYKELTVDSSKSTRALSLCDSVLKRLKAA